MSEKNLALIFDLDGTLWNSSNTIYKVWDKEISISKEEFSSLMGKTNNEIVSILNIDEYKLDSIQQKENEVILVEGGLLYPHVLKEIKKLAKKYKLYIVSNCQKGYVEAFLDYYKLNKYFEDFECSGNTKKDKRINLKRLIKRNKIRKGIFIGDTKSDLVAANFACIPFVNVKYGFGNFKTQNEIYDIQELDKVIKDICNNQIEYRDLYDKNKLNIFERVKKGNKIPLNKYYITVVIFIENSNNELFLQINRKYDLWSITGGHPKSGENSIEGAIVELKEELNLDVNSNDLEFIKSIRTDDDFVDIYYLKKDFNIEDIKRQEEEVGDVNWFSIKDVSDLICKNKLIPAHLDFYNCFLEYKNKSSISFE